MTSPNESPGHGPAQQPAMGATPRTDAMFAQLANNGTPAWNGEDARALIDFARTLERELAQHKKAGKWADGQLAALRAQLSHSAQQAEELKRANERLRGALHLALPQLSGTPDLHARVTALLTPPAQGDKEGAK